ncbi:MAG TPA: hypothetical protein VIJ92_11885, partial [Ginsengibacter sp.]
MKKSLVFISLFLFSRIVFSQIILPYKNPKLSIEERVKDLIARMTPEEKFWQLFMIPGDLSDGK